MWLFLAFRNLFRNIRRTIAILCTVALGAGALLSFDSFIMGVLDNYRESTIHAHYGFGQINTKGYRDKVFSNPTKQWMENADEVEEFLKQQPGVEKVFPRSSFSAILKHGKVTVSGYGQGIEAVNEADFFTSLNIEEGEHLRDEPNGILLGRGLANSLDVHPGDTVKVIATSSKGYLKDDEFVVTGIFHTGSADFDKRIFRVQLDQAQRLVKTSKIETISLSLTDLKYWAPVAAAVEQAFPNLEAIPFDELDKIYYKHSVDWLHAQFRVVLIIILSIVLLGIFNTISSSILERKQEIGNLRANGESVFQVMRLIMAEGVLLSIFGSLFGMGITYVALKFLDKGIEMPPGPGMTRQFLITFHFAWSMLFTTTAFISVAAFFASFLAGIRVAKMPIAQSLRSY